MPQNAYKKADFWSKKAFARGYPARSVWKLEELDKKFSLFKGADAVLDLGAAPGSWTMYALERCGKGGRVVSVDLVPLAESVGSEKLAFIQGDMASSEVRQAVGKLGPYSLVICDAAPATTGSRTVDVAQSEALAEAALLYAEEMLKEGGSFAAKVFQGGGERALMQKVRGLFSLAKAFKPEASRASSFELYVVGLVRAKS